MKFQKPESANLISYVKKNVKKSKITFKVKKHRNILIKQHVNNNKYFFCKKWGYVKKDCFKYKWLIKKGKLIFLVCYESFFISNAWWIDTGFTIHIINTMQAGNKRGIYLRNQMHSKVKIM